MRQPKIEPRHDYHLSSAFSDENVMSLVLKGHLVVEAMLSKILSHAGFGDEIWKWPFPEKINKCKKNSPLPEWVATICLDINDIRNDYCHSLGHVLEFDEAFQHVKKWNRLGLEYTDETIFLHKNEAKELYGVEGILTETLSNTMDEINSVFGELGIKETYRV